MTIADTVINTITTVVTKPMIKSSPKNNQFFPHETDARKYYERYNQNFQRSYPTQSHTNRFQASSNRFHDQQPR